MEQIIFKFLINYSFFLFFLLLFFLPLKQFINLLNLNYFLPLNVSFHRVLNPIFSQTSEKLIKQIQNSFKPSWRLCFHLKNKENSLNMHDGGAKVPDRSINASGHFLQTPYLSRLLWMCSKVLHMYALVLMGKREFAFKGQFKYVINVL